MKINAIARNKKMLLGIIGIVFFAVNAFGQNQAAKIDGNTRKDFVKNVCDVLDKNYVFPERAKSICEFIKKQSDAGKYDALSNPDDFADQIASDFRAVYNDKHLRIEYNPKLEQEIIKFVSSKKEADKISAADIAKDEKKNFHFRKVEILSSNIGYIELTNFTPPSPSARKTVNAAMQFVSHTDALILDLRNNFGGNGEMANEIAGYFFDAKTLTGRNFNRIENKWFDNYVENKKTVTQGLKLEMPIYILTSNRTFSAAEGLAYVLKTMKNAVVIGDTTRGGAHLTRSFSLGNGFVGFIPYMRGENVKTKTDWEGTGIVPDIKTEVADSILIAQNTILERKLSAVTDETEKRKINWLINYNKSKNSTVVADPANFENFAGRFAEFEISFKDNQLLFRDVNQANKTPRNLIAITPNLFQVGYDYQVEFIVDEKGLCNSIKMYWEDGWTEVIKRTEK